MTTYAIVYIGATWCSSCKVMKPSVEVWADCYNLTLRSLDYDADLTDEEREQITKVPTIRIIDVDTGATVATWNVNHIAQLKDWLKNNVNID
jgi:thiol-disulfide isomerase/thioredoxin